MESKDIRSKVSAHRQSYIFSACIWRWDACCNVGRERVSFYLAHREKVERNATPDAVYTDRDAVTDVLSHDGRNCFSSQVVYIQGYMRSLYRWSEKFQQSQVQQHACESIQEALNGRWKSAVLWDWPATPDLFCSSDERQKKVLSSVFISILPSVNVCLFHILIESEQKQRKKQLAVDTVKR